jgi:DNA-3-methyladenine glycosylase I
MTEYHDKEWGVPLRDARALWEMLMLEGFQAGLSWRIILHRREGFRAAFAGFDPARVAAFTEADVERLMNDPGIIRARAKILATIEGAKVFLRMRDAGEDFGNWAWGLAGGKATAKRWPPARDYRQPSRWPSKNAASNSSARSSSMPGCRRSAWWTTTRQPVSGANKRLLFSGKNRNIATGR